MNVRALTIVATGVLLTACHGQTTGSPVAASVASSPESTSATTAPLAGVSPPTTSAPNPNVTTTTFDGCAVVTDSEAASWGVDPARKHDLADATVAKYDRLRGCYWQSPKSDLRVYATNGTLTNFGDPNPKFDHKEQVQFGSRQGWIARDAAPLAGCSAFVTSQQGIAVVQLVAGNDDRLARTDLCPNATEIMKTIEPRIP